jgi:hypothetical protein
MIRSACILIYRRFITNIFTQYYNHINFNWRKELYVIYRHNITLAAAVSIIYWYVYYRGNYNCMSFQSNTWSQETKYHDHNIQIDYSMFEGSFLFLTQYYNHINFNWRKEFYVIYRHSITLAAAVEIYVLVNTISFIIAFKYKRWWYMH